MALPDRRMAAHSEAPLWGKQVYRTLKLTFFAAVAGAIVVCASASAFAQDNVLGLPKRALKNQGSLVICGGGTMSEDVYDRFVELAGGRNARLVIIPTAATFENVRELKIRFNGWRQLDVAAVDFLDADSREDAEDAEFAEPLRKATGVWIAGGMQGRLTDIYGGTLVERAVRGVLERGGVVGGTSAGAAIMSRTMIRHGVSRDEVVLADGFGLLSKAVVDMHFSQRKRLPRLLGVLYDNPGMVGIGVDENTALVVQGNRLEVLGEATVTVCMAGTKTRPQWVQRLKSSEEARLVTAGGGASNELATVRLRKVASSAAE